MKSFSLYISGIIFLIFSILHWVRYFAKWDLKIGDKEIALQVSLWIAAISLFLALWMFIAAGI